MNKRLDLGFIAVTTLACMLGLLGIIKAGAYQNTVPTMPPNNRACIVEAWGCAESGCLTFTCCSDSVEVYFLQWEAGYPYGNCHSGYPGSNCLIRGGTDPTLWVCCAEGHGYAVKDYVGNCQEQSCTMYRTVANKCP